MVPPPPVVWFSYAVNLGLRYLKMSAKSKGGSSSSLKGMPTSPWTPPTYMHIIYIGVHIYILYMYMCVSYIIYIYIYVYIYMNIHIHIGYIMYIYICTILYIMYIYTHRRTYLALQKPLALLATH